MLCAFFTCAYEARAQEPKPVVAPEVVRKVDAAYPASALAEGRSSTVVLLVTIEADGGVSSVDVAQSGGPEFDAAAIDAVRQWRFEPARRGGVTVASRIRVPFRFSAPAPVDVPAPDQPSPTDRAVMPLEPRKEHGPTSPLEPANERKESLRVTVHGHRRARTEERSVSDFRLERDVLVATPRQEGADMLRSAPGLYVARPEGPAVAHGYMLRGFDAEHGQDIEFHVGGLPINLPSHIHGQGYADLGFLIGAVVQEVNITEGVYDPRQGDFAVAGSIDVTVGVQESERGVRLQSSYGSFNTFRELALWAPPGVQEETVGAVQYTKTDGFGENRAGESASGILQHCFGDGDLTYRLIGIVHEARSDFAGVLRKDDIDSGRVCFHCVYPFATARAQNALSQRVLTGVFGNYVAESGQNGEFGLWLGRDSFRLQENYTGFIQESQTLPRVAGKGDLIEQRNQTTSIGLMGRYRTAPFRPAAFTNGTLEMGADGRIDTVDQMQNLLDAAVRSETWDRRIDATVRGVDLGFWGDLDFKFPRYVRSRLGFRADMLSYEIEDRLGNFAEQSRPQDTYIVGFRRSAAGLAFGPRASVDVQPLSWMTILAAYGEGYRSPQARILEDGERAPFSKVRSADFGFKFDWGDPLRLTLDAYYTHLSEDVVFEAAEGRLERIGATQRLGATAHLLTRPRPWLVESLSVTVVDATLREAPPGTSEDPEPPFEKGQRIPYVPPVVVRGDIGAKHTIIDSLQGAPFGGRAGLGFSFLSPRPLPYGQFADPVALLDLSAGVTWGPAELLLEVFNVTNDEYAAFEYNFPSHWDPDGPRTRTPARHITAGAPRSWMLSLGVTL